MAPENPVVSIICTTYNQNKFIAQALDGFVTQRTTFLFEIIVHDDASTDNTADIVKEYEAKYPHLFANIYQTENQYSKGTGEVSKVVFGAAHGKYIALCEGDDYWTDPLKLQRQVDFLEANPDFAICFHRVNIIHEDISSEKLSNENQKEVLEFEDLALSNYIHTPSCVYRNGLFEKFPDWFYQSPIGDWVLHLLNAQYGKIKFLEDVMAVYRIHNNGIWSMKDSIESYIKWIGVAEKCRQYFYPKASSIFMQNIANKYEYMSFIYFERNDFKNFRKCYRHYLKIGKNADVRATLALKLRYLLSFLPFVAISYKKITQNLKLNSSV